MYDVCSRDESSPERDGKEAGQSGRSSKKNEYDIKRVRKKVEKIKERLESRTVMKQCSGYEVAVIVMNPLDTLPLTSYHNNKDVHKGATL
jgi:hypothetical protein